MNIIWKQLAKATAGKFSGKVEALIHNGVPVKINITLDPDVEWAEAEAMRAQLGNVFGGFFIYGPRCN